MGTVTTLPRGRAFTRSDLDAMPDDGRRYELIDGVLIVTPAPARLHQRMVLELAVLLHDACPPELELLTAPFDVALDDISILQPDLLVARRADFTKKDLPTAPLLAVEVLSPSTRRIDLTLKRSRYESAGCPSYWVLDPDQPSISVWQLEGTAYVGAGHTEGDAALQVTSPFPVEVVPAALVR